MSTLWKRRIHHSSSGSSSTMLIDCSFCGTALMLPAPGATSIICAVCKHVTMVPSSYNNGRPPPQHSPSAPSAHGSKRALICGVSYRNTRQELKGTVNDARCMKHLLVTKFQFPESAILLLTEDQADPLKLPTKHNIRMAMWWLVQGCQRGDSLVFHFSGHGSQRRNYSGDEVDNRDETLLPMDFKRNGVIVDDDINLAIVRPLPRGARLHAIVDACHSGTVLDLPFLCKIDSQGGQYGWEDHRPRTGAWKGTSGGDAYCFSGCDDDQVSTDTTALSHDTYTGAMTFTFIQAIELGNARTYREILIAMRKGVQKVDTGGPITALIQMLLTGGVLGFSMIQEPQLTSSTPFIIDTPFYL